MDERIAEVPVALHRHVGAVHDLDAILGSRRRVNLEMIVDKIDVGAGPGHQGAGRHSRRQALSGGGECGVVYHPRRARRGSKSRTSVQNHSVKCL